MSEGVEVAVFALIGIVATATASAGGVVFGFLWRRIGLLEARLTKLAERERRTAWWARQLQDYYYRYRRDGAPDLPEPPESEDTP